MRHVRAGEVVIITHRGRPVARLSPIEEPSLAELDHLVAAGLVRRGTGSLPDGFRELDQPADPDARVRAVVQEERERGW